MKTFCFKLYHSEHNYKLMRQINAAGLIYNHCIALHNLKRKKKCSPPKFRKVRRYKSYTLKQAGWKLDEARGKIRIGQKWYGYFKPRTGKSVGLDFGLKQFLTGSDGHDIKSPYFFMLHIKKSRFKTARMLCEEYAVICLETLIMKGMARRWGRKVHSLGFKRGEYVNITKQRSAAYD